MKCGKIVDDDGEAKQERHMVIVFSPKVANHKGCNSNAKQQRDKGDHKGWVRFSNSHIEREGGGVVVVACVSGVFLLVVVVCCCLLFLINWFETHHPDSNKRIC